MKNLLPSSSEWQLDTLRLYEKAISELASDYGLDTYPNQIEIINAEQMLNAYSSVGMPVGYHHWSFGKKFMLCKKQYELGQIGLAYEIVINANPCIAYLTEDNSTCMQALVIAHACYGHNSFFKNNYLFKMWTTPETIVDYLIFARDYIHTCEDRYGIAKVEALLDACHALMNYGVDRYQHPKPLSRKERQIHQHETELYLQSQVNELWQTLAQPQEKQSSTDPHFPEESEENILYFIEKNAPLLKQWQRDIIGIVRHMAQYFYPQRQTKIMNEGWASFWHYRLIHDLYEDKRVTDEFMLEFIENHTNALYQPDFTHTQYQGLNPYTLGFNIFSEIKRISESPTQEDQSFFPELTKNNWFKNIDFAMRNFKDDSFIYQYLSPSLIREMRLFSLLDDDLKDDLLVSAIHNQAGYQHIRKVASRQYNLSYIEPDIQIYKADLDRDRNLILRYNIINNIPIANDSHILLTYLERLWGFPVILESINEKGDIVSSSQSSPSKK